MCRIGNIFCSIKILSCKSHDSLSYLQKTYHLSHDIWRKGQITSCENPCSPIVRNDTGVSSKCIMIKISCHCDEAKPLLQCERPASRHVVQCIAADIDVLRLALEWVSHQEEARPDHLLYRSSETESSPSACTLS